MKQNLLRCILGCWIGVGGTPAFGKPVLTLENREGAPAQLKEVIQRLQENTLQLKYHEGAMQVLQQAIQAQPQEPKWYFYLANLYARQARQQFSLKSDGEEILESSIVAYRKAIALADQKKLWRYFAEQHLEELGQRHLDRGMRYYAKTSYERALDNFKLYQSLKPDASEAALYLGIAAQRAKQTKLAIAYYQKYLQQEEVAAMVYAALANLTFQVNPKVTPALHYFEQGLEKKPYDMSLLISLYRFLVKHKQLDVYLNQLEKRQETAPEEAAGYYQWATLQVLVLQEQMRDITPPAAQKKKGKKKLEPPVEEENSLPLEKNYSAWKSNQLAVVPRMARVTAAYVRAAELDGRALGPLLQAGNAYYNQGVYLIQAMQNVQQGWFESVAQEFYKDLLSTMRTSLDYFKRARRMDPKNSTARQQYKKARSYIAYILDQQDEITATFAARERLIAAEMSSAS